MTDNASNTAHVDGVRNMAGATLEEEGRSMTEPRTDAELQASAAQDKANGEWVRQATAEADARRVAMVRALAGDRRWGLPPLPKLNP